MAEIALFTGIGLTTLLWSLYALQVEVLDPLIGLGMILGVSAILMWWVAIRLDIVWRGLPPSERAANPFLNQMRWLFMLGGTFLATYELPHVILILLGSDESTVSITHFVSHIFLLIYLLIAARIAGLFVKQKYKNYAIIFVVLMGLSALIVSITNPDRLVRLSGSDYPFLLADESHLLLSAVLTIAAVGVFGAYLILMSLRPGLHAATRVRAFFMGLGFQGLVLMTFFIDYPYSISAITYAYISGITWSLGTGVGALYAARWRK